MDSNNPYSSPQANLFSGSTAGSADMVTQGTMLQLKKTKPWVRFISVMMFIGAGFMLLLALIMGLAGGAGVLQQSGSPFGDKIAGGALGVGMAALYGLFSVLYIYPALKLWKYADRIRDLCNSMHSIDLEKALNEQRAFWKFIGVMIITMFVLYFVIIIVAMAIGVGAMMKVNQGLHG